MPLTNDLVLRTFDLDCDLESYFNIFDRTFAITLTAYQTFVKLEFCCLMWMVTCYVLLFQDIHFNYNYHYIIYI